MKIKNFIFLVLSIVLVPQMFAKTVDQETARTVATNFYYQQVNKLSQVVEMKNISITSINLEKIGNTPIMYVVDFNNGGFVLVSAQESVTPILGFNTDKEAIFNINGNPEFRYFIADLMRAVEYSVINNIPAEETTKDSWATYTNVDFVSQIKSTLDVTVGPLLLSTWNQDYPYNYYCPLAPSGPGGRCYAGCVATAMSAIMHYYQWPPHGNSQFMYYCNGYGVQYGYFQDSTYDWSLMPNNLTPQNSDASILASALIQYHAGVSVSMQYAPDGSGAYSNQVPNSLKNYFLYPQDCQYTEKQGLSTAQWENILKNQLDQGYVLYHSGHDNSGGHAWCCDGYQVIGSATTFHHNFNWGGYENGWYTSINPNGFTNNQGVVQNFRPNNPNYPSYCSGNYVLTNKYGRIEDGSGPLYNYLANTDATWLINPQHEHDSVSSINLSWERFQLGPNDYIRIYDGGSTQATLVGEYSGTNTPQDFKSTGNQLFIVFHSTTAAPGFSFVYSCNYPKYCNSTNNINLPIVEIYTNPEDKYYVPNTLCRWNIQYSGSIGGDFEVISVDTYNENDYLSVLDIGTNELHTYYGNVQGEKIRISASGCYVTFKSDGMFTSGFGAHFKYIDDKVGISSINIGTLDLYPNPANNKLNFSFESDDAQKITIQVCDMIGKVVYKNTLVHHNKTTQGIDISSWQPGVYIFSVKTSKGTETRKVIIN